MRLLLILTLIIWGGKANSQILDNEHDHSNLTAEMYRFFMKTVCENYYESDTVGSLMKFVEGYKNSIMPSDYSEPIPFSIKVNKSEIKRINKTLFIRDDDHYYHYYLDFVGHFPKQYKERAFALCNRYPGLRCTASLTDSTNVVDYSFYSNPVIIVNTKEGSFLHKKNPFYRGYFEMAEVLGGHYSLFQFSCALLSDSPDTDLHNKNIRNIATVFYWKVLCQNAGVDFHKPLTTQAWKKELKVILEE